jgi:phage terminase large subunit GpA-like protein
MSERIALHDIAASFGAFTPPKRVSVSQGAAESLYIKQPGGYTGPWSADETPYMVEPMDELASRSKEAVVFVGPARTGKTLGLLDGWMARNVTCDPGDMLIVQMTQDKARDYSKTRVDRAIRYSPALRERMSASGHDDNTHDKMFRNGMWLKIGWPTVTQLSSSDYRYVGLTDYDRMPDDVDGEGEPFGLALKRTQTFMSRGMCMVESSPGREITDPNWRALTPHEAPPCAGVLGIYNRSDRRRFYWPCPECREFFEAAPGLGLFGLPSEDELLEIVRTADIERIATEHARVICPHCGSMIGPSAKHAMNKAGRWVADGQHITAAGVIVGEAVTSTIAGFWLGGVAATYQSWRSLISRYLLGLRDFVLTGPSCRFKTRSTRIKGSRTYPRRCAARPR